MSINLKNYEAWLTDYIDGNLSSQEKALVEHFLSEHPELDIQIEDLELEPILSFDSEKYPLKEKLKKNKDQVISTKSISIDNYDETFIAFHEKLLDDQEKLELKKFIEANPSLKNDLDLYGKIRFTPDLRVQFPNKSLLKRRVLGRRILWLAPLSAVAASLALIWIFSTNNPSTSNYGQKQPDLTLLNPYSKGTNLKMETPEVKSDIALKDNDNKLIEKQLATNSPKADGDDNIALKQRENTLTASVVHRKSKSKDNLEQASEVSKRDSSVISMLQPRELASIEVSNRQVINDYQNPIISALRLREKKNTLLLAQKPEAEKSGGYTGFKVPNLIKFAEKKLESLTSKREADFQIKTGRAKTGELKSFSIGGEFLKISHSRQ